jgi:hypothetical protein
MRIPEFIRGGKPMTARLFRSSLFALVGAGLALVPVVASASNVSATLGAGTLTNRVAVTIPVTVTCAGPFWDPSTQELFEENISISVEQASGKQIASGTGQASFGLPFSQPQHCDGTAVTIPVTVLADPTGPPFHGGSLVVSGFVSLQAGTNCGVPGCYFNIVGDGAAIGPASVPLH